MVKCVIIKNAENPSISLTIENNLATLYHSNQVKYDLAELLCKECLMKSKVIAGPAHPDTLRYMNSLAVLYKSQGESDSIELLEEYLSKGKSVAETDPYILLTVIHTLCGLYDERVEYSIIEQMYTDCLSLSRKVLGEDHQDTLLSLHNLAMFYSKQGDYSNAKPLLNEYSSKKEKALGADRGLCNLNTTLKSSNKKWEQ